MNSPLFFKGAYSNYYDSGYNTLINTDTVNNFYSQTTNLITTQWINSACNFLAITANYYNFNIDTFIVFHVFYEQIDTKYVPSTSIIFFNKSDIFDSLAIATLIFSIITLLTSIYMIMRSKEDKAEKKKELQKDYEKYLFFHSMNRFTDEHWFILFFKKIYYSVDYIFRVNFIQPNLSLIISKSLSIYIIYYISFH